MLFHTNIILLHNNNNTFISTRTILFVVVTVSAVLLFFVSTISNQTFAQEGIKQESGSLIQKPSNIYEGLGIKIKYFDPWTILSSSDNDLTCYTKDFCMLNLGKLTG